MKETREAEEGEEETRTPEGKGKKRCEIFALLF